MEYIYAALLLHKLGKPIDENNLRKVITATGASVDEAKVKTLLASLKGVDVDKELQNAQVATVSATAGAGGAGEAKAEEKKEEVKAEVAAEGLSALFG